MNNMFTAGDRPTRTYRFDQIVTRMFWLNSNPDPNPGAWMSVFFGTHIFANIHTHTRNVIQGCAAVCILHAILRVILKLDTSVSACSLWGLTYMYFMVTLACVYVCVWVFCCVLGVMGGATHKGHARIHAHTCRPYNIISHSHTARRWIIGEAAGVWPLKLPFHHAQPYDVEKCIMFKFAKATWWMGVGLGGEVVLRARCSAFSP